jgi:asparagine synthase (glutamine-hydrolysing)
MCGINGFTYHDPVLLSKMMELCKSRGPDGNNSYLDQHISISHNRLSILDLSKNASQPFIYKNLVLSFNGEIFNFLELKNELKAKNYKFTTNSDTEVLIKLFYEFNIDAFKKISGIFAISIWDLEKKILYLIRDIVGVKPLYYYADSSNNLYFSSLIKPLLISASKSLNLQAANYYWNMGFCGLNETIFKNIYKVLPGELIIYKNKNFYKKKFLSFDFDKKIETNNIKNEIKNIINKQTISDVPIALSLSGGIDSNIILSAINRNKIKTYNVSYSHNGIKSKDSIYANIRSKIYNTTHEEFEIKSNDFLEDLEIITSILEEPIANQNSISNYFLSKKIKEKVIFSGDGGDEIFTGYNKYRSISFFNLISKINIFKNYNLNIKNKNIKRCFISSMREMHLSFSNQNSLLNNSKIFTNFKKINSDELFFNHLQEENYNSDLKNIMFSDIDTWVQNDVLMRNDKIFMSKGIEVRVPFLDQEMIEKFLFLESNKLHPFKYKNFLKNLFKDDLKKTLTEKKGFDSPYVFWLKEEKNLSKIKFYLSKEYYNSELINYDEVKEILSKNKINFYQIFSILVFQIFLKQNNF